MQDLTETTVTEAALGQMAATPDPRLRKRAGMTLAIGGSNYGKPYPPVGGAAALPRPNPPRPATPLAVAPVVPASQPAAPPPAAVVAAPPAQTPTAPALPCLPHTR